jgi:hypothetical protein
VSIKEKRPYFLETSKAEDNGSIQELMALRRNPGSYN